MTQRPVRIGKQQAGKGNKVTASSRKSRPHLDSVIVFCPVKRFATEDIFSARVSNIIPKGAPRLACLIGALPGPRVAVALAKAEPPAKHEDPCFPPTEAAAVSAPIPVPNLGLPSCTKAVASFMRDMHAAAVVAAATSFRVILYSTMKDAIKCDHDGRSWGHVENNI